MRKIYVDTTIGIHINDGIVNIILGSDSLENKFLENSDNKKQINTTNIISMPVSGFIETFNIFEQFIKESHTQEVFQKYIKVGVLNEFKDKKNR